MMQWTIAPVAALAMLAMGASAHAQTSSPAAEARPTALAAHPVATSASAASPQGLAPGTIINVENAERYANFIPAATMLAIQHGLRLEVAPTQRMQWSRGFEVATEKYSAQVGLDQD